MGSEERKLKKHLQQRAKDQLRKLAKHNRTGITRPSPGPQQEGLVIEVGPGACIIQSEAGSLRCSCRFQAVVGDRVLYSESRLRIEEILPRSSVLCRPDPHNSFLQRIIDVVPHVVSI